MKEWNDPSEKLPVDGEHVDVVLIGGRKVAAVEFAAGRFWKVRRNNGGHAYAVEAWREVDRPKRSKDGTAESMDG